MRIFGVDPGSVRTGYGCIEIHGSRHRLLGCGVVSLSPKLAFSEKLEVLHSKLVALLEKHKPNALVVEDLFLAKNARSALKLGHVRGVVLLAGAQAGIPISEYTPTEVKLAVAGYGRAEKHQVQKMVTLLLGLEKPPSPLDVSDALAVAVCHANAHGPVQLREIVNRKGSAKSWRQYRPKASETRS